MATTAIFTMGCKNGHKVDVDEATARDINATACAVCYKPLFVKGVKTVRASKPVVQRCPHHSNGDPICRRQKVGA